MKHLAALAMLGLAAPAFAQVDLREETEEALAPAADLIRQARALQPDKPVSMTLPLFGRLLRLDIPDGFVPAYKAQGRGGFLFEFVPDGEKIADWSRLVTISATSGAGQLALDDEAIAERVFKSSQGCALGHFYRSLGSSKRPDGASATPLVRGCDRVDTRAYQGARQGWEYSVILHLRDADNIYSLQYAERGDGEENPGTEMNEAGVRAKLAQFGDLLLCAPVAEDAACKEIIAVDAARRKARGQ